jgi:hypothetical protein
MSRLKKCIKERDMTSILEESFNRSTDKELVDKELVGKRTKAKIPVRYQLQQSRRDIKAFSEGEKKKKIKIIIFSLSATEHQLCDRYCTMCFTYLIKLNGYHDPVS